MIEFRVEGLPPSYNKSFKIAHSLRQVWLSPEAHTYKNKIKMSMPPTNFVGDELLVAEIDYCYDWYYKNGNLKKKDTQNCDKLVYDAISERLGIDDSHFKIRRVTDFHNDKEEYVIVRIDKI